MSTTTRILTIALAALALAAPVAGASPISEGSPASTQDRHPRTAHVYVIPASAFKQPSAGTAAPAHQTKVDQPAVTSGSDPSPLVYIVPSLVLIAMFAAAMVYARGSRRPAQV